MALRVSLVDPQRQLLNEITDDRMKRFDVAQTYAMALDSDEVDWSLVNREIIDRWSMSGLKWIKEKAWKIREPEAPA